MPLNSALTVSGVFHPDSVTLEEKGGEDVAFSAFNVGPSPGCSGSLAELIPSRPLAPHTTYVITVSPIYSSEPGPTSVEFTTGTTMLPDVAPEPPKANASVLFDVPDTGFGCASGTVWACVGVFPDWDDDIEIIARRGDEIVMRWDLPENEHEAGAVNYDAQFAFEDDLRPDCLEVRRRTPTGRRSEAVKICGDALKARPYRDGDIQKQVVSCRNGVIGSPESQPRVDEPRVSPPKMSGNEAGAAGNEAGAAGGEVGAAGGEAGAAAPREASKNADAATPRRETYGCSAVPGRSATSAWILFLFALVAFVRGSRRR